MRICNLGSGSDGNMTYIESQNAKILIDIGFSTLEATRRLALLGVLPEEITAILVTHEHSDHIKGIDVFACKYGTKIYVHKKGATALKSKLKKAHKIQFIEFDDNEFFINDIKIKSFALPHDSKYCCGYTVWENGKRVSFLTDCGFATTDTIKNLEGSTLVYLEANHDEAMLRRNPNYPAVLKERILGKHGHLSNISAGEIIEQLAKSGTKQVMLSHLSTENNTPTLAYNTICNYLKTKNISEGTDIKISVTSTMPSSIFNIRD